MRSLAARASLAFALATAACGDDGNGDGATAGDAAVDASSATDAATDGATDGPPTDGANGGLRLADMVVAAPGHTGTGYGDSMRAINGVRGGGSSNGSLDVFSLGYTMGANNFITLAWSGNGRLANGPGPDLAVFENPFQFSGGTFMDLVIVEVSIDGVEFRPIAHDYAATDPTMYRNDPQLWVGFAGRTPVLFHQEDNVVDPFDSAVAGGDAFDLDTVVGDDAVAQAIRADGIRFVRLVTAPSRNNPDTSAPYVRDNASNGADIDGVYGRYVGM
jgi:hypothetical protein